MIHTAANSLPGSPILVAIVGDHREVKFMKPGEAQAFLPGSD
jgi:hypothetical protein